MTKQISARELREEAERRTGLSDFGDFDVLGPFGLLCDSLNAEAALNSLGHRFATERLVTALSTRLKVVEDRKRIPEIAQQVIRRPIVMAGLPRSGTTVLFNLLAQDPSNRSPAAWEVMLSSPPPERATYHTDPRIAEVQAKLDSWGLTHPDIYAIHPFRADMPEECPFICEQFMVGTAYAAFWNVPSYIAAVAGVDRKAVYAEHRKVLQHLQVRNPGERWLLKWSGHLSNQAALTAIYPDVAFIQTHRDMRRVMPSYVSLTSAERSLYSDDPRNHEVDSLIEQRLADRLEQAVAFRQNASQTFIDVLYTDLLANPMAVVRDIYRKLDLELTPQVAARMQAWLADNGKGKHGKPDYSRAMSRISEKRIDTVFARYMQQHAIPREDRV